MPLSSISLYVYFWFVFHSFNMSFPFGCIAGPQITILFKQEKNLFVEFAYFPHGFSLATLVSSYIPKICMLDELVCLHCAGLSECGCEQSYDEWVTSPTVLLKRILLFYLSFLNYM